MDPRVALAAKDVAELKTQWKRLSSVKGVLIRTIKARRAEAEELAGDPAHGPVAAKELEMARIRLHVFKKSLTPV